MVERSSIVQKLVFFFFLLLPFQFALSPLEGIDVAFSRVAVLLIGGIFLAERLRMGAWRLPPPRSLFPVMGFLLLATLSLFWTENPLWTLRKAFFLISFIPIWFCCTDIFFRGGVAAGRDIARGFFFGSVASAGVALLQFISQFIFSLDQILHFWLSRIYPIFLGEAFAQSVTIHPSLLVNIAGKTILRATGLFPDPHVAAFYFGMAIPFGIWLGMNAVPTKRIIFFLGTGILFLADLCTFSRGGYVGLFAMAIFFGVFSWHQYGERFSFRQKKNGVGVALVILLSCWLIQPVRDRLSDVFSVTDGSNSARIALWGEAITHIEERPLLGYGLGNYPLKVLPSTDYREPIYIHNTYLDLWAELGIVGLMLFLGIFLLPVWSFFFRGSFQGIAFPGVLALVLFLAHSFFENVLFSVHIFPVLLFLIAMVSWNDQGARSREQGAGSKEQGTGSKEQSFVEKILIGSLLAIPLLVVFAAEKVVFFGTPLYVPELLILLALISAAYLFFWQKKELAPFLLHISPVALSLILIVMGLILSAVFNDVTLHGYGRMKSWFFFPTVYGILMYFSLKKKLLSIKNLLRAVFFGGILIGAFTLVSVFLGEGFSYDQRLHGFFSSPNQLAMLLGTALITGVFLWDFFRENMSGVRSVVLWGIFFLGALILLTQSYATIFSLLMIFGIGLAGYYKKLSRKQGIIFLLGFALCIGTLLLLSAPKWQGIMIFDARSSLASRGMIWHSALRMIENHPSIGIGPGNFQKEYIAYQHYFPPYLEWSAPHPHNSLLDMWLEGGILSATGFVLFSLYWVVTAVRYFRQKKNESAFLALPLFLSFYFLLIGLTDVPFLRNDLAYFFVTAFVISRFLTNEFDRSSHPGG